MGTQATGTEAPEGQAVPSDREVMAATRPFMEESRPLSWWHLISTLAVLAAFATGAVIAPWWPLQLVAGIATGLTMVRTFILVHDLHHNAIFRGSPVAKAILEFYGLLVLTPSRIWRDTHNYHHAHTAQTEGPQRGTFTLFTTQQWRDASRKQRLAYRIERHPLTLSLGYLTVFLVSFGFAPFFKNPRRHLDSGLSLLVHGSVGVAAYVLGGPGVFVFAFLLPFVLSGAAGAYLFYAQHNYEGITIPEASEWSHVRGALEASSFLKLGRVMRWFTGDIGYHHVHHLNPRIPFYRLKEAMDEIPALQHPVVVKARPSTLFSMFRLKLWDPEAGRMVGYKSARA